METADAVVIGGGVIGTSVAYRLAKERKVILLERKEIGGQTSGNCDKAIILQSKKPGFPIKLAKASRRIYDQLEEELETSIEYNKNGGMILIEKEEHLNFMKKFVDRQNKAGLRVKLIDAKEAKAFQPYLSDNLVGATYSTEDAEVNPLLLTQAFSRAARRSGVDIRLYTEVVGIDCQNGRVVGVKTDRGYISTELVINAAGPFAGEIAEMVGVPLTIIPRRGVILISEKVPPMIHGNILCSQYIAAKHQSEEYGKAPPFGIGLSLGQTDSGNLLIGGSREFTGYNKEINPELLASIASHAIRMVPSLGNVQIIRSMIGFRPFTGNGLPIIDEVPGVQGFVIAAGHEGDGIALAPITGILVASLVAGESNYKDLLEPLKLKTE
ncbi:NAD(P)/FAD-dependent oxidoreductase [Oceanobacillus halophilus]|nr:FAD-dependent oxidoreductase [Oceanobacillus halophilus]